jgi:hypothetical protein
MSVQPMKFEKLTKEYLSKLGQLMPERARFFIWRLGRRIIAFSICMVHDGTIYDEYLGLDYSVALDLHLYFYTLRDIPALGHRESPDLLLQQPAQLRPEVASWLRSRTARSLREAYSTPVESDFSTCRPIAGANATRSGPAEIL